MQLHYSLIGTPLLEHGAELFCKVNMLDLDSSFCCLDILTTNFVSLEPLVLSSTFIYIKNTTVVKAKLLHSHPKE